MHKYNVNGCFISHETLSHGSHVQPVNPASREAVNVPTHTANNDIFHTDTVTFFILTINHITRSIIHPSYISSVPSNTNIRYTGETQGAVQYDFIPDS